MFLLSRGGSESGRVTRDPWGVCDGWPMPRLSRRQLWVIILLAGYVVAAAVILLSPVSYSGIVGAISTWIWKDLGLFGFGSGWIEFIANILLFLPLGFLLTLLFRHPWYGALLALGLSVAAELAQFVIPSREPALRDILANVVGAALGALLAWLFVLRRRRSVAGPIAGATGVP